MPHISKNYKFIAFILLPWLCIVVYLFFPFITLEYLNTGRPPSASTDPIYFKNYHAVYVTKPHPIFFRYLEKIKGADAPSFIVVGEQRRSRYALDIHNVYLNGIIMPEADPESFQYLGNRWSKDVHHVFAASVVQEAIDSTSFYQIAQGYAQDKSHLYYLDAFDEVFMGPAPVGEVHVCQYASAFAYDDIYHYRYAQITHSVKPHDTCTGN